ncbi:hypothetical protein [Azonexus sp. IMCC34839]|uniref:hypothetical protein n=1 Tax=Azonexus sp. IMCC34839 TaxID=3133695 RepID=UPI0039999020
MKRIALILCVLMPLAGCGVETAGTAATAAAAKKQELEAGKQTMQQFQQKLDQANALGQQRAEQATDK